MIIIGDAKTELSKLPEKSVNCCVTSPPYFGLRDYGHPGQIGLEETPEEFVNNLVEVFREVSRALKDDGTLWLNLGDSYVANNCSQAPQTKSHAGSGHAGSNRNGLTGLQPKNLIGIPWRVAFALQSDGWYLRQDIIWAKPNPMPESVRDRCTKSHEYIFLFSKSSRYYFDSVAIKEPQSEHERTRRLREQSEGLDSTYDIKHVGKTGQNVPGKSSCIYTAESRQKLALTGTRNKRSVWTVSTKPYKGAHFATFPPDLIEPCVLAGCPPGGVVLDPFGGSGTVGAVAKENDRDFILIELNPKYEPLIDERLSKAHFQHSF